MQRVVDWPARMKEMAEFVGLTEEDRRLVRATGPLVLKHAEALTAAVYDHFLQFPEAREFFMTDGEVDEERLARRRHSLERWLRSTIEFKVDDGFPVFVLAIGLVHSYPSANRAYLGSIPSKYMIGTMSFAQSALADLLVQEMDDPREAVRASAAWNKLLMLQLDILLAGYVTGRPMEPAASDPSGEAESAGEGT